MGRRIRGRHRSSLRQLRSYLVTGIAVLVDLREQSPQISVFVARPEVSEFGGL